MIIKALKAVTNREDVAKFDVTIEVFADANALHAVSSTKFTVDDVTDATIEALLDRVEAAQAPAVATRTNKLRKAYSRTI